MSIPNESHINARRLKSISSPADFHKRFFQVNPEPVARFMVEKLISLAVTNSHHAKIIRDIPNYCFDKLKETIQNYTEIQFIAYDRDDLESSNENYLYPRSEVDKDEKNISIISKLEEDKIKQRINKSELHNPDNHKEKMNSKFYNSKEKSNSALKFKKALQFGKVPFKPRNTAEGFNTRVPHSRMYIKSKPLSQGVMDRGYATTTEGFFKRKKKILSPLKTSNKETKELIKVLEKGDKEDFARTTTDKLFKKK